MGDVSDLIEYLTEGERVELDAHLIALAPVLPHAAYQRDPIKWAVDKLGIPRHTIAWSENAGYAAHSWDGTADPLVAMAQGLVDWQNVGCESGTTTGKSYWVAILILWFLACHENARVFTFAPKEDQLRLFIWMEMGKLWPRFQSWFPLAKMTDLSIRMRGGTDESWAARGYAVGVGANEESATKAQGMHGEHMLLIYEETPGIPQPVIEAGVQTSTAPHNLRLAIGNPNHQLDTLHLFCQMPRTVHVRISALDHPNVVTNNPNLIPGAVSRQSIDERRQSQGEASPRYQSRVRGVSPEQAVDALIRLDWLKRARIRYEVKRDNGTLPTRVTGKGVDVANSEHGDKACIVDFAGTVCIRIDAFQCPDANLLGSRVVHESRLEQLDPMRIGIDAIGVGAGTVNEARRLGCTVMALYAGGKPMAMAEKQADGTLLEWAPDVNAFENLRGQMYWQAREDLRKDVLDVPYDKELWQELCAHTFEDDRKVVKVLPKDKVKEILGRSPDKSDAFVMANWVRIRAVEEVKPVREQGRTAGYDYDKQRPAEKLTAEDELRTVWDHLNGDTAPVGRYNIPTQRRR